MRKSLSKEMIQEYGKPLQIIILYHRLWLSHGSPVENTNAKVNKSTISIFKYIFSDEVAIKPAYQVRYDFKNKLSKLSRQSNFIFMSSG